MNPVKVKCIADDEMSVELQAQIDTLLARVFSDVDGQEITEDFISPRVAQVVATKDREVIGWAGLHNAEIRYNNLPLRLGGFGIGVHEDYRRLGIGTRICQEAMSYLTDNGVEVAFLSARLYARKMFEKVGFVPLPHKYSWENVRGKIKVTEEADGMIAPVNSKEKFGMILHGTSILYVGRGYW
jgi:GNAT superfamily N-acetyltransferase